MLPRDARAKPAAEVSTIRNVMRGLVSSDSSSNQQQFICVAPRNLLERFRVGLARMHHRLKPRCEKVGTSFPTDSQNVAAESLRLSGPRLLIQTLNPLCSEL
jgi:hypothetical protein